MSMKLVSLTVLVAFCWALSGTALAQTLPGWLRVQAGFAGELNVASGSQIAPNALASAQAPAASQVTMDRAARLRQKRARRILAAGAGFMLSAAITPAYVLPNREPCWGSEREKGGIPLKGAIGTGAVGFAFSVGGGTWLAVESRRHGYYVSKRERLIAFGVGAVTLAVSQLVLFPFFVIDQICNN